MWLLDSNIWLEALLSQSRAGEVVDLLKRSTNVDLFITSFSLHSIGVLLVRRGLTAEFDQFVGNIIVRRPIAILSIPASALTAVTAAATAYGLDFDDAYQYAVAERFGLQIISFDADFDRTPRGRQTPAQALASLPPIP